VKDSMKKTPFDTNQEPISNRLITGLAKISLALKTQAWKGANERGLSPTQGQILALLARDTNRGQRLNDLAEALAVTAATTSDAVKSLEQKGFVTKTRSSENARALSITLTDAGRAEAARSAEWPDVLLESVSVLSSDEQAVFLRALVKMLGSLQEREQIPVSSMCITCRFFQPNAHSNPNKPHHCDFVNAAFGDASLRLECNDHDPATPEQAARAWHVFTSAR
jgi:DNA-binding MarR family transcriptional regulator